ncbi:hypothetical protein OUZ56_013807 [Daphnia magna]|uniref:Uncharacterized protein n=1 Tax=Daphnia magna TaxID=35525 RepID=A0ABQ9Z700_9CRUS|nr:hypothetical protein OUZ56_013807 [Daphnia magna]
MECSEKSLSFSPAHSTHAQSSSMVSDVVVAELYRMGPASCNGAEAIKKRSGNNRKSLSASAMTDARHVAERRQTGQRKNFK